MKTTRQKNKLFIEIPSKFDVKEGIEYIASKTYDGSLIFIPKSENIFKSDKEKYKDLRPY
ncbi:type II toxin-antitoxin system PemI/MazE family antitoxin [Companilactobacillus mishanensis]|uniref:AbrB family transcriptional regulator n=1 Tax=Companilactobacillus mishanensis TaxID=2486008 RepID=A0ABW9P9M0_9LACO|nr:AbrB family transcriptional regulator [Companilactobacillus mishanensis]MQS45920.1 AbrB family transcriptional regulator [Companilactobacillus mishanensis]MQS89985.1 AbrB family transcriptional regulator [Companilactobacillus mishanensis]